MLYLIKTSLLNEVPTSPIQPANIGPQDVPFQRPQDET